MWLLLISVLRAGSFGSIIMAVLNRRVSRCHWESINTHSTLALFLYSGCELTSVPSGFGSRKATSSISSKCHFIVTAFPQG